VRSAVIPALENVALWHERDISHSSVERMIGPDATVTLDFALHRMAGVVEKLVVYPARMRENLLAFGSLFNSQRVLLALTQAGVSREEAYAIVQRNAVKAWHAKASPESPEAREAGGQRDPFAWYLARDPAVTGALGQAVLDEFLDEEKALAYHLKQVDAIFSRVFG